jgi:hypothetical protein
VRSEDGGVTLGAAQPVSRMQWRETSRMRALPLPSGAVDGAGNLYVAWHDCRFRAGCSANDIVVVSSRDGITWSAPTRIPVDATDAGSDHFVTGLDADPTATGKLAVVYAFFQPGSCAKGACLLDAGFSSSADGGATWSPQVQLGAEGMSVEWIAQTTGGAMIGDYYSVSFAGGRAVPVFTLALPPVRGRLREAIFAASLATAGVRRP